MKTPTIAELLKDHVTLTVECVDRFYLNGYVQGFQTTGGLVNYLARCCEAPIPSPAKLFERTRHFIDEIASFAARYGVEVIHFKRGERKEDVALRIRRQNPQRTCVQFIGVAQEKQSAFKASKQEQGKLVRFNYSRQPAFVNQYYFYLDDEEFGPGFIKVGSYFPFPVRVCFNGHEWAKRQLEKRGIAYKSLDNGFLSCAQPEVLQEIGEGFGAADLAALFARWMARLPWPVPPEHRRMGFDYQLAVWQLEYSRTEVFARPVRGREFFEEVIRENLDLGRPDRVQLVFDRRIRSNTPGSFKTRVITDGVAPNLHIPYKKTGVKQYFKENRALRTETTINDPLDFKLKKGLKNLAALIGIARNVNRRLLEVERVSQDCVLSDASVQRLTQPSVNPDGKRAPGLKLADPRVRALLAALCLFLHVPEGFRNRDLRTRVAALLGVSPVQYTPAKMGYDLRRLRLKGIIFRRRGSTRCYLSPYGLRVSLFLTRLHARLLRPGLAAVEPDDSRPLPHPLRLALDQVDIEVQSMLDQHHFPLTQAA
jgi:hypothetical protein